MGVHKTACLTNLFSRHWYCVEASDLICGTYWLIVFFVVGMSTGVFRAGYTISFFLSLAFSLLDFLGPLLIVFEYSVCLIFFIKCFFSIQDCAFPLRWCLVNFGYRDFGEIFTDVTPWSLQLFLNIPLFIGKSFTFKW